MYGDYLHPLPPGRPGGELLLPGLRPAPACLFGGQVPGQGQPERWNEPVRDASTVDWKPAMRPALTLAVPAGLLCSLLLAGQHLRAALMAVAAAWAVALYMRSQRPAWITIGAGARIGLVTGLLGGWMAAAATGLTLFVMRFFFTRAGFDDSGKLIDDQIERAMDGCMGSTRRPLR